MFLTKLQKTSKITIKLHILHPPVKIRKVEIANQSSPFPAPWLLTWFVYRGTLVTWAKVGSSTFWPGANTTAWVESFRWFFQAWQDGTARNRSRRHYKARVFVTRRDVMCIIDAPGGRRGQVLISWAGVWRLTPMTLNTNPNFSKAPGNQFVLEMLRPLRQPLILSKIFHRSSPTRRGLPGPHLLEPFVLFILLPLPPWDYRIWIRLFCSSPSTPPSSSST